MVAIALQIIDENGADALTLRALAQRLGSSTATIYRHVQNRADLMEHVVERVLGEVQVEEIALEDADWTVAFRAIGRGLFDAIGHHPHVAPVLAETVPTGPNAMALRERGVAVLLAHGFEPEPARVLTASFARLVIGFAMQLRSGPDAERAEAEARERLRTADPDRYPALRETAAAGTSSLGQELDLALDLFLAGMARAAAVDHTP
ncbi:TetR/AcrR family transcriptional regulator [Phycicoccus flavus]|uniref:TetR/AcrR family transcriptional regulator n=1 Tax=Phycicoccus flavus TaxID=2502783 RepID=UPI000FEBDBD7|nr:TetR/AcrR family transcriptional regulator C-terminal domain-containing protein [Phycicoccus flavus]NHA68615.1 TetR family transcriptional regulator [Phycicoccus flavus]NHA68686.1 TetR family transcriptional regulator [Phycicoccus flavus]